MSYASMEREELVKEIKILEDEFNQYKSKNLRLNMARGKPCSEQLDLINDLMTALSNKDYIDKNNFDCRNYGIVDGISELKALFSELLNVPKENLIVFGNSSLNLMYDTLSRAMLFGMVDSTQPWIKEEKIKFLCPSPGYDRHFGVTQDLGIEMITIPMTPDGPDMDMVESLAAEDESIKGIWCVPLYSNPSGAVYSPRTCERLASMKTAAEDFTIMWDNSYFVHFLGEELDDLPDIISLCAEYGHPNRAYEFTSTSKITWPGAGVAVMASSSDNIANARKHIEKQTIGPDKINQLRQAKFLKDKENIIEIMKKHRDILKPKFDTTLNIMENELGRFPEIRWTKPKGGYFISIDVFPGTAKEVIRLCKECGVEYTPAGATYPYGVDPEDKNIRIAPSYPPGDEIEDAIKVFCAAVKLAGAYKAAKDRGIGVN